MGERTTRLNLSRSSVLVVEDNPHAMEIASQIFLGFGVRQIQRATCAKEADRLAEGATFDLMLVDCELPDESGFAFVRRARANGPNRTTGIIVVSGYTPRSKVERARDCGAHTVLCKPLAPGLLLDRIAWIGRGARQFVESEGYCGPDRRHRNVALPPGQDERRAEALALTASPERALSQNEINSLFD